jgi:hypothetical protein
MKVSSFHKLLFRYKVEMPMECISQNPIMYPQWEMGKNRYHIVPDGKVWWE